MITQQEIKELFDYRADGVLIWRKRLSNRIHPGQPANNKNDLGYIRVRIYGKLYKAHRLIYLYHYGYMPDMVDHINQNKSDNRIENLRETSKSLNGLNGKPRLNRKYRGVTVTKNGKISARLYVNKISYHLGYFSNVEDAAQAYNFAVYLYSPNWGYYNIP